MTDTARQAVLDRLMTAGLEFDAIARAYAEAGMFDDAEVAHDRAMLVSGAYVVESRIPRELEPPCFCPQCAYAYRGRVS